MISNCNPHKVNKKHECSAGLTKEQAGSAAAAESIVPLSINPDFSIMCCCRTSRKGDGVSLRLTAG